MADAVLTVLLLLAVGASLAAGLRAVRHWYGQRAGLAYELPVDRRGTAVRAGVSGAAALLAAALAVPLLDGAPGGGASPPPAPRPGASPPRSRRPRRRPPAPRSPRRRPPRSAPSATPSGGTLQVLRDGTRVWLPPRYDSARAARLAYPVVLVHATGAGTDLYAAFARQAHLGFADPFLLVSPPVCGADPARVLAEVSRRYRALTARGARAVVGIGGQAPCAVREALAHPDRYRAGAGVSGSYPPLAPPAGPYPALLLAAGTGESAQRASDQRLHNALHPKGDQVRVLDGAKRRDVLALVATYLTEKLDSPTRQASARPARAVSTGPAPDRGSEKHSVEP